MAAFTCFCDFHSILQDTILEAFSPLELAISLSRKRKRAMAMGVNYSYKSDVAFPCPSVASPTPIYGYRCLWTLLVGACVTGGRLPQASM